MRTREDGYENTRTGYENTRTGYENTRRMEDGHENTRTGYENTRRKILQNKQVYIHWVDLRIYIGYPRKALYTEEVMAKHGSETRVQKLFILDMDKPEHKSVNQFLLPLERGLQSSIIVELLSDFIRKSQDEPNVAVKKRLFSGQTNN